MNSLFNSGITESDIGHIRTFISLCDSGVSTGQAWAQSMANASVAGKQMAVQVKSGKVAIEDLNATSVTATIKMKALAASATAVKMALNAMLTMAVTAALQALVSAIQSVKEKQEEAREAALNTGDAAKSEAADITELYIAYQEAAKAYESSTGSKEDLTDATDGLLSALGLEEAEIEKLTADYDDLNEAIDQITLDALEEKLAEVKDGYIAAKKEFDDATKDGVLSYLFGTNTWDTLKVDDLGIDEIGNELQTLLEAGLIDLSDVDIHTGDLVLGESALEEYEKLVEMRDLLSSTYSVEELEDSKVWSDITAKINDVSEEYEELIDYIDTVNDLQTQLDYSEYIKTNGVPETTEEFETLRETLISTAQASEDYVGTQEQINDAVINTLSTIPALTEFFDGYSSLLSDDAEDIDVFNLSNYLTEDFLEQISEYRENVTTLKDALTELREEGLQPGDDDFSELFLDLVETFPELADDSDDLDKAICDLLDDLNSDMIEDFSDQFDEVDSEEAQEQIEKFKDSVLELGQVVGTTAFSIDIDAQTEGMENLYAAISESASATGLTAESIANIKERYQQLESYDAAELFETTANGVRLNATALRELESEYETYMKDLYQGEIDDLVDQYNVLTEAINNTDNVIEKADLYAQRDNIKEQLEDIVLLSSEYDGLTSSYNKWIEAQSTTDENDMYLTLSDGIEDMKELFDEGWVGVDDFREFVQLMTDTDLSTASTAEILDMYDQGIGTVEKFFDGTVNGLLEFLNVAKDVSDQLDQTWVTLDENGEWHLDFDDAELANAINEMTDLQVSVQEIQVLMRALEAAGFVVTVDTKLFDDLDLIKTEAEEANEALKELGYTDYTFHIDSSEVVVLEQDIEQASALYQSLLNPEDSTLPISDEDIENARVVLESLLAQKLALETPSILNIDTTDAAESIQYFVESVAEFQESYNNIEIDALLGVDATGSDEEMQNAVSSLSSNLAGLDDDLVAELGLDDSAFQEAVQNILDTDIEAGVTINQEDIDMIEATLQAIDPEVIEMQTNSDTIIEELQNIDEYTIDDKDFTVTAYDNATSILGSINAAINALHDKTVTVTTINNEVYQSTATGGTRLHGTAFDNGTSGEASSGAALGGELGPELLVSGNTYRLIGENGAEFFHYNKGDVVFDAAQTKELLTKGKITSSKSRGRALLNGTVGRLGNAFVNGIGKVGNAFSTGVGSIYVSGKVTTTPSSSGSSSSSDDDEFLETFDWIELAIDRIERAISHLDTTASSVYQSWSDRNAALGEEIGTVANEIELQAAAYERYIQQANSVGLDSSLAAAVRSGAIDISTITDEDLYDKITEYQEWYEKALDCADAIQELAETESELYETAFDNVITQYENILSVVDYNKSLIDEAISQAELSGYIVNAEYYEALIAQEQKNLAALKSEKEELAQTLQTALDSGTIAEGSEAWAEMCQEIDDVTLAIEEANTALIEYSNSIRDIEWSVFDLLQSQISNITTEADFLIDLLSNDDLYTDKGQFTDEGMSTVGLHAVNYDTYMAQADKYAEEIKSIDEDLANDPYNQDLIDRRQELLELQQESILAAEDEKSAIISLVEDGMQIELDYLQDLIDSYEDALDSAYDLYKYNKEISEQTAEVASLRKQISAYSGDTSEETKSTVQQLKVKLEEAESDLEETQYEQYISDQKELLDTLYDEYEFLLNSRLDDIDMLFMELIADVNANSSVIGDTIAGKVESVGYTLTDSMEAIWTTTSASTQDVVAVYASSIADATELARTTLANEISNMSLQVTDYISAANTEITSGLTSAANSLTSSLTTANSTAETILNGVTSVNSTLGTMNTNLNTIISSLSTIASKVGTSTASSGSSVSSSSSSSSGSSSSSSSSTTTLSNSSSSSGLNTDTSIVDRLKSEGTDSSFSSRADLYAEWCGSDTYTGSYEQNVAMLNYMKANGLATGAYKLKKDGTYLTQEKGLEAILRPGEGVLTPLSQGDSVLNAEATAALFDFANNPAGFLYDALDLTDVSIPSIQPLGQDITFGDTSLSVSLPNVTNYDDFKYALQHDKDLENMLRSMTTDRLFGGSGLKKYKY